MGWTPPRPPRREESGMDTREFLAVQDVFWRRLHGRPCAAWMVLLVTAVAVILAALVAAL
jgi:hypothetical protein